MFITGYTAHPTFNIFIKAFFSMKLLYGKQNLAQYHGKIIYINLDALFRNNGNAIKNNQAEKSFGRFLILLSAASIIFLIVLLVFSGEFNLANLILPETLVELSTWILILPLLFGFYLKRKKEVYEEDLKDLSSEKIIKDLAQNYGDIQEININNLLSFKVKEFIDFAYFHRNEKFLIELLIYVLSKSNIQSFVEKRLGVDYLKFRESSTRYLLQKPTEFSQVYKTLFIQSFDEALKFQSEKINEEVLFFTLIKYYLKPVLLDLGVTDLEHEGLREWFRNETKRAKYFRVWQKLSRLKPKSSMNRSYTARATPTLDEHGVDFTNKAANRDFVLTLGKEDQMKSLLSMLQRVGGPGIMILGEPGVGKTLFIKHLATRMVVEDVPKQLQDYRLVVVDLNKILTKTASIENFKQIFQKILDEIKASGNIIICFEELSQIFNLRDEGRNEVINLLSNALDNSNLKVIATSTTGNYERYVKPNKSFSSKFETIVIKEPDPNILLQILIDESRNLTERYGVEVGISAIKRIVDFGYKFDYDRAMPDKGLDLLEEAIINAQHQGLKYLDISIVDSLLQGKTGVNVGAISEKESETLKSLESKMHERVIGQDEAIRSVAAAIRRSRSGLSSNKRPIASFLFFGPTGVGKTEVAKTLAEVYYGSENLMIRIDMSEYQEESNLARLIGYTDEKGNFIGGLLTEKVRSRPFSLILFDEIEKANKKVLDLFLQILDDGFVTDGIGRRVIFTNSIIIMTTNAGTKEITNFISKGENYHVIERQTVNILREHFRIEFLNRFDKLVMFRSLSQIEIEQIVDLMLKELNNNLLAKGISFEWDNFTQKELAKLGYNPAYGARELRRVVQEEIEDKLANLIIDGSLKPGKEAVFRGLDVKEIRD